MAHFTLPETIEAVNALLSPDEETNYEDVRQALIAACKEGALRNFHTARRAGAFSWRVVMVDGELQLMMLRKDAE